MLAGQIKESSERLKTIQSLIPDALRAAVQAGPIDGDAWCLLVTSNAAAAKLRQLSPLILSKLNNRGVKVNSIRLKILIALKR
ncbi:MAG: DciA family protein [Polaromonas sp.]